jgi:hypothetical protein
MNWSHYQEAIFERFEHSRESLLIEATAGAGKTTVLVELSRIMQRAMPGMRGAFLAFNRNIADELGRRIGSGGNVRAMTLHSAGNVAWQRSLGLEGPARVSGDKVFNIMREVMSWDEQRKWGETTRKLVGFAKGVGLVPKLAWSNPKNNLQGLLDDSAEAWQGLIDHYGLDEEECNIDLVRKVLAKSIEQAGEVIDFDDMLFQPVIAGVPFDKYEVVLADECQDLSVIQHEIISRMAGPDTRVIGVGDRNQAIYSWRGAHANSMDLLKERFNMQSLPLSVSYRCPMAVVRHARQWVPRIEYAEDAAWGVVMLEGTDWAGQSEIALGASLSRGSDRDTGFHLPVAPEGGFKHREDKAIHGTCLCPDCHSREGITKWRGIRDFLPGDAVLCRLNRPLVEAAFAMIRVGIACQVMGRDIGKGLVDLVKKSKAGYVADFLDWLQEYERRQRMKYQKRREFAKIGLLSDRCRTLEVFCQELPDDATTRELTRKVEGLFSDGSGQDREMAQMVVLATVHKFKGMEADRVFVLDAGELMPSAWARMPWELEQEKNLMYVAATRAIRELRYITSEDLRREP